MNTTRLKQARRLFCNDIAPRHIQRANMRQWAKSVRALGGNWQALPNSVPPKGGVLA